MIFDILGWIGAVLILLAYALNSLGKIENGKLYQTMNFLAALFMATGLLPKNAWFSFSVQVVWAIVAIVALIKLNKNKKK